MKISVLRRNAISKSALVDAGVLSQIVKHICSNQYENVPFRSTITVSCSLYNLMELPGTPEACLTL